MSSEHVEVLRVLRERAAEWGHETENLSALDAAIAALSAPQPPAEAQAQGGGEEGFKAWVVEQMPAGTVIGNPAWWADRLAQAYAFNVPAPPSAPVGVERIAAEIRASLGHGATVATRRRWAIELEALAQQPAAVDDSALLDALAREYWKLDPFDMPTPGGDDADVGWRVIQYHGDHPREREVAAHYGDDPRAALRAALAAQQGGSDNDR